MQRTRAARRFMFLSKVSLYFISSAALASFWPFVAFFLCHGRTPVLAAVHPFPGSYLPTKKPWKGEKPFLLPPSSFLLPPSMSFELLSLRISLHFGLGFRSLHELLLFFSFLIFCGYHIGVQHGQYKGN